MNRHFLSIVSAGVLLASCSFLLAPCSHAQSVPSSGGVTLSVSSENPAPGQQITITAASYSASIDSSKITWSVNGKVAQSGNGLTTLTVTAPALGKKLNIKVTMVTNNGQTTTGSTVIGSGSVDLVTETDGYVPPSFRGKAPVVYQNSVTVVAVPHIANSDGVEYDPKTLIYQWSKNNQILGDQSGYGKQSIMLVGDIVPRAYDLSVNVTPRTGSGQAESMITITPQSPSITFYINDPLYGPLFNLAINSSYRIGSQREANILAIPYGFNKPANKSGDLSFSWLINNVAHPELTTNDSVILRAPVGTAGASNITLSIANNKQILQSANSGFTAMFTAASSNAAPSITN